MLINIRAIKVKVPVNLESYIKEKLSKSQRFFQNINEVEVFLSRQKYLHNVEVLINVAGQTIKTKHTAADFYSAIDLVVDKVEQQLAKQKEKMKKHRKPKKFELEEQYSEVGEFSLDLNKKTFVPQAMSMNQAVNKLEDDDLAFWIFINSDNRRLSVVYKKSESDNGLIEIERRSL